MDLDVFTFITRHGADYAEYLKQTSELNLSGKHKINWKYVESLDVERKPKGFECVCKTGGRKQKNTIRHSLALKKALDYIKSDYVLFVDMDVVILYKDWDDVIINKLNKYDCFGGAYNLHGNSAQKRLYNNFPKINLFAFRRDILEKVDLDFSPFITINNRRCSTFILSKDDAHIFEMKKGSEFRCDTGWKLPMIFKNNGLTNYCMPCYLLHEKTSKLRLLDKKHKEMNLDRNKVIEEWHYNDKVFATHKKHSRTDRLDSTSGLFWKHLIELYMK